ncbi:TrbG/VirB9 family P-type conjugative transfer protein [Phenylobacterium sp.]|uniref:TrbG/VirB9 family P-type conjugative transfer protein n=1 Tax=Phenylobacterium sp. TaxID=1871053 RepID=UPI00286B3D99|nr:TrbG/VirB9 family P-type conjugative transfer protein [Phenylobacterium sp.]
MKAIALILLLAATPFVALGAETPRPGLVDPRIQTVEYDPDQVVVLRGALNYQLMLEFAPGERIENVSIGDSMGWQVTPNRKANLLFLKPIDRAAVTNMTVVTNQRRYAFDLRVAPATARGVLPYVVRFAYPQVAMAVPLPPEPDAPPVIVNRSYAITGAAENAPVLVFDDGRMTYFEWPAQGAVPAIFAVGVDGAESLVNYGVRGRYIVVEQLAPRFALRNGKQVATVINNGFTRASSQ